MRRGPDRRLFIDLQLEAETLKWAADRLTLHSPGTETALRRRRHVQSLLVECCAEFEALRIKIKGEK